MHMSISKKRMLLLQMYDTALIQELKVVNACQKLAAAISGYQFQYPIQCDKHREQPRPCPKNLRPLGKAQQRCYAAKNKQQSNSGNERV
jgi:hypothetical protein